MKQDPLLAAHRMYYVREMRVLAYSQMLESYRSVTLESMAKSFGVSVDFIDAEVGLRSLSMSFRSEICRFVIFFWDFPVSHG